MTLQHWLSHAIIVATVLSASGAPAQVARSPTLCEPRRDAGTTAREWNDPRNETRVPGVIVGRVTTLDGRSLPDAIVRIYVDLARTPPLRELFTDSLGRFHWDSLPPRSYVIGIQRLGFQTQWHAHEVVSSGVDTLCIVLRPKPIGLAPVSPSKRRPL